MIDIAIVALIIGSFTALQFYVGACGVLIQSLERSAELRR